MAIDSRRILHQLGCGESVDDVRAAAGLTEAEFEAWWNEELQRRLAVIDGRASGPVAAAVEIQRDASGLPHIYAETEADLFVGYGYAMAQDRLFQMDYLRRRALGRLAEILGPEAFDYDVLVRTVGLHRIAADETARLPAETAAHYEAFATGVNAFIEDCRDLPPIEFDLLDYRPEAWRPLDSIALLGEFRWYLTGRFPVIAVPELARRALGDGPLYRAFMTPEAIDETILHPGEYASADSGTDPVEPPLGGIDDGTGSKQLGDRPEPQRFRRGARGQRSAHRLRCAVLLVSSPPGRRTVQRGGGRICGGAGHHLRSQPARRLGHHQQHQLAARPLPGAHGPGASRRLPL